MKGICHIFICRLYWHEAFASHAYQGGGFMTAIRIAGIGVGGIFRAHLRGYKTLSDSFSLVALCDINEEAAQRIAEENKIQRVYTSVEALLKDGDIDAVDICLPHDLHAPVAIAAAEAG